MIQQLEKAIKQVPPLANIGDLLGAMEKLASCFLMIDPCNLIRLIVGVIQMILSYIGCLIDAFESILQFQAGLDLNSAAGNPVLLGTFTCAQNNAQTAADSLNESMQGIAPLIDIVNILLDIAGQPPIELPAMSTGSLAGAVGDPLEPVKKVRDALQQVINTLDQICPP